MKAGHLLSFVFLMVLVFVVGHFLESGPHSFSVATLTGKRQLETMTIALAVKDMLKEEKLPKDLSSIAISRTLLGQNPNRVKYIYAEAFHVNGEGEICDPSGKPYMINIGDRAITVRSAESDAEYREEY